MTRKQNHWMVEVARSAGLPNVPQLAISAETAPSDAWSKTCQVCGIDPQALATHVARHHNLPLASVDQATPAALRLLPARIARLHGAYPLRMDDRTFVVATADPTNLEAEQDITFATGRSVEMEIATPARILEALAIGYSADPEAASQELPDELVNAVEVVEDLGPEQLDAQQLESAPVVRLTNIILRDAVRNRASDVHFEPGRQEGIVRFRVDGVMRVYMRMPMRAMNRVVSRIKVIARLDIADRLRPQDGRARIVVESRTVDLRVSTVPTREAEKAVLRILAQSGSQHLTDMALQADDVARIEGLIGHRDGIVIVTGPTGSGKTTTLYAILRQLANGEVNVMTVEDPIEYELPGVTQIQVESRRNVTFATALRAILRQDPDIILVGEIRDLETAEVAVHASMTGHLVLTTLHTNDAVSAVARLADLGVERSMLATSLRGVVAQRLVRRVCPDCAEQIGGDLTAREAELAERYGTKPQVRATGCTRCGSTGYEGRIPVTEVLAVDTAFTEQITAGATAVELQRIALSAGLRTLRDSALARVAAGETTLDEVERVLGERLEAARAAEARPKAELQSPRATPVLSIVPRNAAASDEPLSILVVDDDDVHRAIVRRALEGNGYHVLEAASGSAALEMVSSGTSCALILTDLYMPGLGGRELLSCLRAMPQTATIPVVVATSEQDEGAEIQLIEAGADDYVRKPVEPTRLLARIRATLRRAA